MLRRLKFSLCVLLVPLFLVGTAVAAGSAEDAQALVEKAVAYVKANGKDKGVAAFNDPKGEFVKGDLYIFMFDFSGVTLAHGANQKLVGKNMLDLKDANGTPFVKEFMNKVKSGGGWVDYHWTNPNTKKVQAKTTYVKGIDGTDYFVGCGIYK
jgi:cytochrome c